MLEICVDSLVSARAAIRGGAQRLELCSALCVGGLTPYTELLQQIRAESALPIRCLMRPRSGDFLYTPEEILLMARQIRALRRAGADGFVLGCLTALGTLDGPALQPLLAAAQGTGLTLHRCIDVSRDPLQTYRQAAALGFDTVLTSGAAASCSEGQEIIGALLTLRDAMDGPEVLIGAGVSANVITALRSRFPTARAFHASCKATVPSGMCFQRPGIPMGLPGLEEGNLQQTDEDAVRAARAAADA